MSAIDDPAPARTAPDLFELVSEADGTRGVIRACGELDIASAPAVELAARDLWADGVETVALDLGGVSFFDSSGLRLLMRLQAHAAQTPGCGFELADCSAAVQRVLTLTRLGERFGFPAA